MKRCERGRVSVYRSTSGKKIYRLLNVLSRPLSFITHTLSHSLASSFSLFHLSELMNRCCRAVECRMMDCASGGRSQLGKERERGARDFYDFSAIQTILTRKRRMKQLHHFCERSCIFKGTVHQKEKIVSSFSSSHYSKPIWLYFFCWWILL